MTYPSFSAGEVLRAQDMNAVGMWKVASVDFTNTTTINIDNVFTSDYRNYKLICSLRPNSTNTGDVQLQLRAGGSNQAASNYLYQGVSQHQSNAPVAQASGFITAGIYYTNYFQSSNLSAFIETTIMNPQIANWTGFISNTFFEWSGTTFYYRAITGVYSNNAQADGFRLVPSTAITGNIQIYGMKN